MTAVVVSRATPVLVRSPADLARVLRMVERGGRAANLLQAAGDVLTMLALACATGVRPAHALENTDDGEHADVEAARAQGTVPKTVRVRGGGPECPYRRPIATATAIAATPSTKSAAQIGAQKRSHWS